MCDTGYCVALDKFCNGNDDCGDKSDEPPYCSRKCFPRLYINYDNNNNMLCALCSRETINETYYFRLRLSRNAPPVRSYSHTQNISIKLKFISPSHCRTHNHKISSQIMYGFGLRDRNFVATLSYSE